MDNTEQIARQLGAIQQQLTEMRGDIRVLLEMGQKQLEEIEMAQAIRDAG